MRSKLEKNLTWMSTLTSIVSKDKQLIETVNKVINCMIYTIKDGHKIMICGNGGSAADSQHFAAELVNKFMKNRKPLPAISLTTDTSVLTSISNDISYDTVFGRQVCALGNKGDMLIGITTSGSSANIKNAIYNAYNMGIITVLLTSEKIYDLNKFLDCKECCDYRIIVPSSDTPRIQEIHEIILHSICESLDEEFE